MKQKEEEEDRNKFSMSCRTTHFLNLILSPPTTFLTRTCISNPKPPPTQLNFSKPPRRRHFYANVSSSSSSSTSELPLLPFDSTQFPERYLEEEDTFSARFGVLVPTESKTLHLYEARYIALLEESMYRKDKLFVHFVLDPIVISNSSTEASFAARYACLVFIEKVDRLDVGALVSIRGVGRVKIMNFVQADPYLKGVVKPIQDNVLEDAKEVSYKVEELKDALHSLNRLEIKLKVPKESLLQTHTANSLLWAEKEPSLDFSQEFVPSLAERVSFAALQPVAGSSESELLKLQQERLRAMDLKDTLQRLNSSLDIVKNNVSTVAAKLAIQSLGVQ